MTTKNPRISTKEWTFASLISFANNFCAADRVSASSSDLSEVIRDHERTGRPLVIEGFHKHERWPADMFTLEGFERYSESIEISVRNVHSWTDEVMKIPDFVLQSRRAGPFAENGETERLYGKDAACPQPWDRWLQESNVVPSSVLSHRDQDEFRFRPATSRIETLMCYLGVGDTYTPCHKDLCASSGQNLMCYTENNGSSFWFMTESASAPSVSAYFHELGQELDHENHVITLDQLSRAPFKVHILEQKLGDLVLVPPRSCHQVVNYGGVTIKTSWSRMTLKGLSTAYHHELPIYRRVGRPEIYRIKSTIYYALTSRTKDLKEQLHVINSTANQRSGTPDLEPESLARDLMKLLYLYDLILEEERPSLDLEMRQHLCTSFNDDSRIVCDFCDGDIFQSFFECSRCAGGLSGSRIVCPGCYCEGRTCVCETMHPMQCRPYESLIDTRTEGFEILQQYSESLGRNDIVNNQREESAVPQLFQAACLLFQARKDNRRSTKTCSKFLKHYASHDVPFVWALHCPHCHRSTCFDHVLKHYKMHSAEAILQFGSDGTRVRYHQKHQASGTRYGANLLDIKKSQKEGSSMDGWMLLAQITSQYGHVVPSNPKSLQQGWYDPEEGTSSHLAGPVSEGSSQKKVTITTPPLKNSLSTQSRRARRQVYVEVPPPPYPITRRRHQGSDHAAKSSQLTVSSSLPVPVPISKKSQRPLQHPKHVQCGPPPKNYFDSQAAKKAAIHGLRFKKNLCPAPDEGSPVMTLPPDFPSSPNGPPLSSPFPDKISPYPSVAQLVRPQEELVRSALQLSDLINTIAEPSVPEEFNSTDASQTSQPFFSTSGVPIGDSRYSPS